MSTARVDVLTALQQHARPITSKALAERMQRPNYTVNAVLSKAHAYGHISRTLVPGRVKQFLYFPKEARP
jgi:predicted transcriptional regulator